MIFIIFTENMSQSVCTFSQTKSPTNSMNCIEIFNNIKCEFNHLAGDRQEQTNYSDYLKQIRKRFALHLKWNWWSEKKRKRLCKVIIVPFTLWPPKLCWITDCGRGISPSKLDLLCVSAFRRLLGSSFCVFQFWLVLIWRKISSTKRGRLITCNESLPLDRI